MISEFNRNKIVEVTRLDEERLSVHGVLTDSIYSLELNFKVLIKDLTCFEIVGNWLRWTTPECPQALKFLDQAEGFCLERGIEDKIHKTIGRTACRHFANLFIECAYGVRETVKLLRWQEARAQGSELSLPAFLAADNCSGEVSVKNPAAVAEEKSGPEEKSVVKNTEASPARSSVSGQSDAAGFIIDLHVHTAPASSCASDSVETMIQEAKRIGLDGICITDHNYLWSQDEIQKLRDKYEFPVFRANEIVTEQGDMRVFGFYEDVQGIIKLEELQTRVAAVGGFIVAAHPFRGFLTFGADDIGLTKEKAQAREMFRWVDGVESLNGKVTETENGLAREVASGLNLPATGGSDAHDKSTIGCYATAFPKPINSEEELLVALKSGEYQPLIFR
jgi:predicted metal-dependent phosphoesterase TrpH